MSRTKIQRLMDTLFKREDVGPTPEETYMERWILFKRFGVGMYVHHFLLDDNDRHLHDHPWNFVSFMFKGSYKEETPGKQVMTYKAPGLRFIPSTLCHRLIDNKDCWTLIFLGRKVREWGFIEDDGSWTHWKPYTSNK